MTTNLEAVTGDVIGAASAWLRGDIKGMRLLVNDLLRDPGISREALVAALIWMTRLARMLADREEMDPVSLLQDIWMNDQTEGGDDHGRPD